MAKAKFYEVSYVVTKTGKAVQTTCYTTRLNTIIAWMKTGQLDSLFISPKTTNNAATI